MRHGWAGRLSALLVAALAGAAILAACSSGPSSEPPPEVPDGNPRLGAAAIPRYGCGACHVIPGIKGANGMVGPPLVHWSKRGYIAGELKNNGANLATWIMGPKEVEPGTDMPDLGVSAEDAENIAAYLFTLR